MKQPVGLCHAAALTGLLLWSSSAAAKSVLDLYKA
jgi:hypothetical protein